MPSRPGHNAPKLPTQQLAILAVARFAEPMALTSVFPYLPEMIHSFGVPKDEVARWAGLTGAVFSVSQSTTAVAWGRASDKFGRKPIILIGLLSTMICFVIWGMSTSLSMAITVRAIMGGGNGNVGIIRTMVAEMVPEKELQPMAFSLMPLVWSIGSVFGPAFGGFFARPADKFPNVFGDSEFLKQYPFVLPNLIACGVFFLSLMTGLLFLKETLASKKNKRDWGLVLGEKLTRPFHRSRASRRQHGRSFVDDEATAPLLSRTGMTTAEVAHAKIEPPTLSEVFTSQTCINLLSYTFLAFHSVAFDQILPVFLNYPRYVPGEDTHLPLKFAGGFGINSDRIGSIFTIYGVACGFIQFLAFPPLCRRFGALNCFKAASLIFPIVYMLVPFTTIIQDDTTRYAFFLFLLLVKGGVVIIGFPCTTILLTNSASSLRILGTLNGFATTFSGIGRAIGPALTGTVFTLGVKHGYIIAPFWLLAAIGFIGAIPAYFIIEKDDLRSGNTTVVDSDTDDEEEDNALPMALPPYSKQTIGSDDRDLGITATDSSHAASLEPEELSPKSLSPLMALSGNKKSGSARKQSEGEEAPLLGWRK